MGTMVLPTTELAKKNELGGAIDCTIFTGLFSDRTLTDRTLFWMASVRCDFQHQPVWSVFACGRKKDAVGKNNTDRKKKLIFSCGRC
jgi:hypothetical protein